MIANFSCPDPSQSDALPKIDHMEFVLQSHTDYVLRSALVGLPGSQNSRSQDATHQVNANDGAHRHPQFDVSKDTLQEFDMQRKMNGAAEFDPSSAESQDSQNGLKVIDYAAPHAVYETVAIPRSVVGPAGLSDRAMRVLEVGYSTTGGSLHNAKQSLLQIAETVDLLSELLSFSQVYNLAPLGSYDSWLCSSVLFINTLLVVLNRNAGAVCNPVCRHRKSRPSRHFTP